MMEITRPEKAFANLAARAARIGATMCNTEDDRGTTVFILTRHHVTRQLRSLEEVAVWIDRLEGKTA